MNTTWQSSLVMVAATVLIGAARGIAAAHDHAAMQAEPAAATDEHAHHHAMMAAPTVRISKHAYPLPQLTLSDEQGAKVTLSEVLATDKPVVLNFIYTSCTTICPVMTSTMLQLQKQLVRGPAAPRFVSITVDPDFDSAVVLNAYARRYGAEWTFLTGSRDDVLMVLGRFDAWRGNKANHAAVTLMRPANSTEWTRVEGLASVQQLVSVWTAIAG